MTNTFLKELDNYIAAEFSAAENKHGIEIDAADKLFLRHLMPRLMKEKISKFIAGAVEHNDSPFLSMSPDQMIEEALKESNDLPFYLHGYFASKLARRTNG